MKFLSILLLSCVAAFGGVAPVLMNPYTTNTTAAADAHVVGLIGGPTNGVSGGTVSNIVGGLVSYNQFTTNAGGTSLSGLVFTNINSTNLIGTIRTNNLPMSLLDTNGAAKSVTNGYVWSGLYDPTNSAKNVTNGYPWSSLYDTNGAAHGATNLLGTASGQPISAFDTNGAGTAAAKLATNGYPWMTGSFPVAFSNSFVTNFSLGTVQSNWTVVLPSYATNYMVDSRLWLQAKVANPSGITLPLGGLIDCGYVIGTLFPAQPFVLIPQGDGRTFIASMSGDKANFLDSTGQPYSFSAANVAAGFNLFIRFTWTVHK